MSETPVTPAAPAPAADALGEVTAQKTKMMERLMGMAAEKEAAAAKPIAPPAKKKEESTPPAKPPEEKVEPGPRDETVELEKSESVKSAMRTLQLDGVPKTALDKFADEELVAYATSRSKALGNSDRVFNEQKTKIQALEAELQKLKEQAKPPVEGETQTTETPPARPAGNGAPTGDAQSNAEVIGLLIEERVERARGRIAERDPRFADEGNWEKVTGEIEYLAKTGKYDLKRIGDLVEDAAAIVARTLPAKTPEQTPEQQRADEVRRRNGILEVNGKSTEVALTTADKNKLVYDYLSQGYSQSDARRLAGL